MAMRRFKVGQRQANLPEIILTGGAARRFPRRLDCRQEESQKASENRDDNEQLD
jgi:hypothetical protein